MLEEILQAHVKTTARVFKHDRAKSVGASEIGQCARKTFYTKMTKDPLRMADGDIDYTDKWGASRRGSVFEDAFWYPAMIKHYGKNLLYAGPKQKTLKTGVLSGTPDGLLINQPDNALAEFFVPHIGKNAEIVLECKTVDPRINLDDAKMVHVTQANTNIGLFRATTKHHPEYAVISYVNASFFDDITEFLVKFDEKLFERAKERAERILKAESAEQLRPEGYIAGGKECGYCGYKRACGIIRATPPDRETAKLDPQWIAYMTDLARQEREWDSKADKAEQEKKDLQEQIKQELREKHLRKIDETDLAVTWSGVKGRLSYDYPRLRAAASAVGIDIEEFSTVGDPSDRLIIRVKR